MLSNSCRYAIRSVLYLAAHTSNGTKVGVKTIAEELEIPQPFLAKILQDLSKKGALGSTKGLNGGFFLSAENLNQNLLSIVEIVDGINPLATCVLGLPKCNAEKPCPVHQQAVLSRQALFAVFRDKTIGQIAHEISEKDLRLF